MPKPAFSSTGRFDLLNVDVTDDEEQVEEPVIEKKPEISETSNSTLSKSARKRLAKAAAKTSEASQAVSDTTTKASLDAADIIPDRKEVEETVNKVEDQVADAVNQVDVGEWVEASRRKTGQAQETATQGAKETIKAGKDVAHGLRGEAAELATSASARARQVSEDTLTSVKDSAGDAANGTAEVLTDTADQFKASGESLVDQASETVSSLAGSVSETAVSAVNQASSTVSKAVNGATAKLVEAKAEVPKQVNGVKQQAAKQVDGVIGVVSAKAEGVKEEVTKQVNGDAVASAKKSGKKVVGKAVEEIKNVPVTATRIINGTLDALPSLPTPPAGSPSTHSKALSKSTFAPDLPELPTPSAAGLPSNRKRKTPKDFTPSGSGAETPASPNKIGVKFEDGIAPGEGKEGEKIISVKKAILKKDRNVVERTVWTFIMIGGFITLLCLGHPYMILTVLLCQTLVYKEVTALFDLRDEGTKQLVPEQGDRWSKTLNWYFFVVTNYFLYGESIIYYFKHIVFVDAYFIPFARNHRFISFMLYTVGFVGFVANLQRQYLRQQFALFCWVHISLLLIVVSSHFIVNNILEGHIWFFVPASLVICNDVMAYVCGKLFGRTPLIKLSPKKTVEGFVGAFICTLVFGLAWGTFFMRFPYMICPARDLGTTVWSNVQCRPNPVFIWRNFEFTGAARRVLSTILGRAPPTIPYAPFQLHVLVMATFASLVAPFGGFFASGFKRAFNIKDFGHSIPGHGGMTDRMDCQFMMGLFSYVYYSSLIRIQYITVGSIMQTVVTSLSPGEQLELLSDLRRFLEGQGVKGVRSA